MIAFSAIQSIAQSLGGRLVTGLSGGLVLAVLATILLRACRNSSTRFAISFLTLLAIAISPLAACFATGHATGLYTSHYISVPGRWAPVILLLWILGAGIGLCRIAAGLYRIWRIRQRSVELDPTWITVSPALFSKHAHLMSTITPAESTGSRHVSLCISSDVSVPTAIGFFRPAVLLPAWAVTDLSAAELNSILLHELGHLRRWDDWTNLAQKVLKALLFFHPAVWWIDARIALEREIACDDFVLAKTSDARGYAKCLVSVAEKSFGRRALAVAVAAVGRFRQTAARLTRILDQNRFVGTRVSKPALATVSALTLAFLIGLPHVPNIVSFEDAAPTARTVALASRVTAGDDSKQVPEVIPSSARVESADSNSFTRRILEKAELRTRVSVSSGKRNSVNKTRVSRMKANQNLKPAPIPVETSWSEQLIPPTFLVMTQTVLCDESGTCVVNVRAWQVSTVQQAKPAQPHNGNGSKSI